MRSALVETNGAFERLVDLERGWWLDLIESVGGPWQLLDARRARLEGVAAGRARDGELDAVWGSLSRATRLTAEQVRAGGASLRVLVRTIRAPGADAVELSALVVGGCGADGRPGGLRDALPREGGAPGLNCAPELGRDKS